MRNWRGGELKQPQSAGRERAAAHLRIRFFKSVGDALYCARKSASEHDKLREEQWSLQLLPAPPAAAQDHAAKAGPTASISKHTARRMPRRDPTRAAGLRPACWFVFCDGCCLKPYIYRLYYK